MRNRTREEVTRFFTGLDLVPPGVITTPRWRPDQDTGQTRIDPIYAAVGRKPAD